MESSSYSITIKQISTDKDLQIAFDIRRTVFQNPPQNVDPAFDFDGEDTKPNTVGLLAFVDESPAGTCRLREVSSNFVKLERVGVLEEYRKLGVGSALLNRAREVASERFPTKLVKAFVQTQVAKFNEKLGWLVVEPKRVVYEQNIGHYLMIWPPKKDLRSDLAIFNNASSEEDRQIVDQLNKTIPSD